MSTAVTTNAPEDSRGKPVQEKGGGWSVYKPGEGYATRLGLMTLILAYVTFAARQWYYNWVLVRSFLGSTFLSFLADLMSQFSSFVQFGGTMAIAATGLLLGYYYIYIKRSSAEFLIKTDIELGKVTWPKVSPWFKADTQVWGATYVVLIVLAGMTLFVFCTDIVLKLLADWAFYTQPPI